MQIWFEKIKLTVKCTYLKKKKNLVYQSILNRFLFCFQKIINDIFECEQIDAKFYFCISTKQGISLITPDLKIQINRTGAELFK